jgi:hypothetical protein
LASERPLADGRPGRTGSRFDDEKIVACFSRYLEHDGLTVLRAEFEENLNGQLRDRSFLNDIQPLLPTGVSYDVAGAGALVGERLITLLRGDPWRGE